MERSIGLSAVKKSWKQIQSEKKRKFDFRQLLAWENLSPPDTRNT